MYLHNRNIRVIFSFGTFDSENDCACYIAVPKRPINQFKPVQQSRYQVVRAYCLNSRFTMIAVQMCKNYNFLFRFLNFDDEN